MRCVCRDGRIKKVGQELDKLNVRRKNDVEWLTAEFERFKVGSVVVWCGVVWCDIARHGSFDKTIRCRHCKQSVDSESQ